MKRCPTTPSEDVRLRLDIAYDGTDFAGGRHSRAAHGRGRSRGFAVDGVSQLRCGCMPPGAPTPACMPPARSPMSTCPSMTCPTPIRARRGRISPEFQPLAAASRPTAARRRSGPRIVRAPAGFDSRFSALRRHYSIPAIDRAYGVVPQQARYITAWPRPLDVDAMTAASREPVGVARLRRFLPSPRRCHHDSRAAAVRLAADGDLITAHVTADAFCWSMVRSLVGALLAVGERRRTAAWCRELLTATDRSSDFAAAPAHGLTLIGVDYPPDERAGVARVDHPGSAHARLEPAGDEVGGLIHQSGADV